MDFDHDLNDRRAKRAEAGAWLIVGLIVAALAFGGLLLAAAGTAS